MVAKSFQNLTILTEPFIVNNRSYVNVQKKDGRTRTVRWYSDKEYAKMYPEEKIKETSIKTSSQKKIFGFDKDFITIFKGNAELHSEYFKKSNARYCKYWGWYIISTEEIPEDLPNDMQPILLQWSLIGDENGNLKTEQQIHDAVELLIYGDEDDPSEFIGNIKDRLTLELTIRKIIPISSGYGISKLYIMEDSNQNIFTWKTSTAKGLEEGNLYTIKGTVKEHKIYRGQRQTVLTRCALV